jgi:small-conductance mechanosensitive channel
MNKLWEDIKSRAIQVFELLDYPFTHIGETEISINFILYISLSIIALLFVARKFKQFLVNKILVRSNLDSGVSQSIGTIVRYLIIILGLVIIFQSAGLNLSAIGVLAGALGVGIGFGLQNIFNNFISGLIILFERPIKIGDRVDVGGISGDVIKIEARATTVLTNDNIAIIIPNSEFISSRVTNWSYTDRMVRFHIPVGVAYKEDPENIKAILLEVAKTNENVLQSPAPDVIFSEFGDSSLNFELWVWTIKLINRPKILQSQLNYQIYRKFKERGVEIPFPQRDLHIRSGFVQSGFNQKDS